jgi:hypothetical protein
MTKTEQFTEGSATPTSISGKRSAVQLVVLCVGSFLVGLGVFAGAVIAVRTMNPPGQIVVTHNASQQDSDVASNGTAPSSDDEVAPVNTSPTLKPSANLISTCTDFSRVLVGVQGADIAGQVATRISALAAQSTDLAMTRLLKTAAHQAGNGQGAAGMTSVAEYCAMQGALG